MYDLTMTFCRVQEFYESPFNQIRGKKFKLVDYMRLYSKKNGSFTYSIDWMGFNIPGPIIAKLYNLGIDDYTCYDKIIEDIHKKINKEVKTRDNYYLIGANDNKTTVQHELCHGLYFINKQYKKDVDKILKKIIPSLRKKVELALSNLGYCKAVMNDEIQAYFSTESQTIKELSHFTKKELINFTDITLELKANFKKYKK